MYKLKIMIKLSGRNQYKCSLNGQNGKKVSKYIFPIALQCLQFEKMKCGLNFSILELSLRQGEEVLIIGIKSGDMWLPVSCINPLTPGGSPLTSKIVWR